MVDTVDTVDTVHRGIILLNWLLTEAALSATCCCCCRGDTESGQQMCKFKANMIVLSVCHTILSYDTRHLKET